MTTLEIRNLTVRFGAVTAVDDVSLRLDPHSVLGLVGESGSGKSTVARAAVGLQPVTSGTILIDGVKVTKRFGKRDRDRWRAIQMVFQDPYGSLNPRMSIGEMLNEALNVGSKVGGALLARRQTELLDLVHLDSSVAERYPRELSGGMRQRAAIARALASRPAILVADEITSSLDASVQGAVLNLLRDLLEQLDLSLLFISHNLATVRYIAENIAVMHLGKIVETGVSDELIRAPKDPYTRSLLAALRELGDHAANSSPAV
ncbi:MAG: ABC transporter ATP-binding protein [Acidimicrobiales bacterium]